MFLLLMVLGSNSGDLVFIELIFYIIFSLDLVRVRASDVNIYRNDDSGKVFMAPGPTAANRNAPEVELGQEVFEGAEMTIDEILKMARDNPDSEIYIPSNLSEHINLMLNPTVDVSWSVPVGFLSVFECDRQLQIYIL